MTEKEISKGEGSTQRKRTNPLNYLKEVASNPRDFFTLPNILVYVRILLSVLFLVIYMIGIKIDYETHRVSWGIAPSDSSDSFQIEGYLACAIILTCGFTDFLDGFIARKFKQETPLGLLLDPVADKLLQIFIVAGVSYRWHTVSWTVWLLLGILLFKEASMFLSNILIYVVHGFHFQKAYWYGKASTLVLYLTMGIMLFFVNYLNSDDLTLFIDILCAICIAVMVFAWIMYALKYVDMYRHPEKYSNKPVDPGEERVTKG